MPNIQLISVICLDYFLTADAPIETASFSLPDFNILATRQPSFDFFRQPKLSTGLYCILQCKCQKMAGKPKDVPKDTKKTEDKEDKMESDDECVDDDTVKKLLFMEKVKRKPGVLNQIDHIPPARDPRYEDIKIDLRDVIEEERREKEQERKKEQANMK